MNSIYVKIILPETIEKKIPGRRYVAWRRNKYVYAERKLYSDDKGNFIKYCHQKVYVHQDGSHWHGWLRKEKTA